MKTKKIIILSLIASSTLFSKSFDASNYNTQTDLLYGLTNYLSTNVDSNIDTLTFSSSNPNRFLFHNSVYGDEAPSTLNFKEENRAYQNLVFTNSSTSNLWTLGATQTSACNPCSENRVNVSTKSLTLNNTALEFIIKDSPDVNPVGRKDYIENFLLGNTGDYARLNLNNGHLLLTNSYGNAALIGFRSKTIFDITGNDNVIKGGNGAFDQSAYELLLNINKNSSLIINGETDLEASFNGYINMQDNSSLTVDGSRLQLTSDGTNSKYFSTFNNASLTVEGRYGNYNSSVEITNPIFTNSNIVLDNDAIIKSIKLVNGNFTDGRFNFIGDNNIALKTANSKLTGNDSKTQFYFSNGSTNISGLGSLEAQSIQLDSAKLQYNNVSNISSDLEHLYLYNGSELKTNSASFDSFTKLKTLIMKNSTLNGDNQYGSNSILNAIIEDSILKIDKSSRTAGMTFYVYGLNMPGLDGNVKFEGNSKFISRIDPLGKDIGIDSNTITGIKNYADAIYFQRTGLAAFTSDTVSGLANLDVQLEAFSSSLSSTDYSNGGENSDGIYDVMIFKNDPGLTVATADSDDVDFILGGSMPALLKATQVATPSVNNQVSVKFETQSISSLTSHPSISTSNQQNGLNLLVNSANSGNTNINSALHTVTNSQLQSHTNTVHAEPYSSYMTVSLEHTDMIMNSVLKKNAKNLDYNKKNFWIDISHSKGDIKANTGLGNFEYSLNTITLGNDFISDDNKRAGIFASFGAQKMDEHDSVLQDFKSNNYYFGGYINHNIPNNINIGSVFGYGYGKHKASRDVKLSNLNESIKGNFNSHSIYAAIDISKEIFTNSWVSLTPEAGFDYTYYTQEKIKESGDSNFNLSIDKANAQAIIASIGLNAKFKSISDTNKIYPLAFAKYEHDFYANKNNAHKINAALSSHSNYKQEFEGQNRGENSILIGIGLSSDVNNSLQVNGGFVYSKHTHGKELGAGVSLSYRF